MGPEASCLQPRPCPARPLCWLLQIGLQALPLLLASVCAFPSVGSLSFPSLPVLPGHIVLQGFPKQWYPSSSMRPHHHVMWLSARRQCRL